jgi:hypothetical protein
VFDWLSGSCVGIAYGHGQPVTGMIKFTTQQRNVTTRLNALQFQHLILLLPLMLQITSSFLSFLALKFAGPTTLLTASPDGCIFVWELLIKSVNQA